MKALRWHGRRDVRLEEVEDAPPPGEGEVRVRVAYAGICGTDVEEYVAGPLYIPVGTPHPLTGKQAPITLGHEFSGIVEEIGPGVSGLAVGDHVAADGLMHCGACAMCARGLTHLCRQLASLGFHADGGLAEQVTAPASVFVRVPHHVPLAAAALAEPLAVAVRAVRRAQLAPGDAVLVIGCGPVGLLALQAARQLGASRVDAVEPRAPRRKIAEELGAQRAWGALDEAPEGAYARIIDCSGQASVLAGALGRLQPSGRLVVVGITPEVASVSLLALVNGEREVVGSLSHLRDEDFALAVRLLAQGGVDVRPLTAHIYPLGQAAELLARLACGQGPDAFKVLIAPGSP